MTSKHKQFVELMCQIGEHMTDLIINKHRSNIAIIHTIKTCPNLIRFRFTTISDYIDIRAVQRIHASGPINVRSGPPLPDSFEHLKELWIGVPLQKITRVEPLLQMCPNLRYFGYARDRLIYPATVSLDKLFTWCPKLNFLELNTRDVGAGPFQLERRNLFLKMYHEQKNVTSMGNSKESSRDHKDTLVYFIIQELNGFSCNEIASHLERSASTMKCLVLGSYHYYGRLVEQDWTDRFRTTFCFPQLHTLICEHIRLQSDALVAMVQHCPGLQILVIKRISTSIQLNIPQLLEPLKQLKHLEISNVPVSFDGRYMNTAVRAFQHWIENYDNRGSDKNGLEEIHLNLTQGGVPSDLLTAITFMSTLKKVSCTLTTQSMQDELSTLGKRFKSLIFLESICFRKAKSLTFDLLSSLSELPSLTIFYAALSDSIVVDDTGFMKMLCKKDSRMKEIHIECPSFLQQPTDTLDKNSILKKFQDLLHRYYIHYSCSHTLNFVSK